MTTRLAHDTARCYDNACPRRQDCARWVQRNDIGQRTPRFETCQTGDTRPEFWPVDEAAAVRWA